MWFNAQLDQKNLGRYLALPVQPSRSSLSFLSCFTIADVVLLAQPFAAGAKAAETFHLPPVIKW